MTERSWEEIIAEALDPDRVAKVQAHSAEWEVLREVHRIVERRDGAVYRTEYLEDRWVPMDSRGDGADLIYVVGSGPYVNPRRIQ
jgi:hypothetical protein